MHFISKSLEFIENFMIEKTLILYKNYTCIGNKAEKVGDTIFQYHMADKATQEVTGVMYVVHLIVYFFIKSPRLSKVI